MKELEINCVGKCTIQTVKGKDITLKAKVPDSMKDRFGLKNEDDKVVCGVIDENDFDVNIDKIEDLFKGLSTDSIQVEIGIPEKIEFKDAEVNLGATDAEIKLKKYKIKYLTLNMGAGKAKIYFLKKNKIKNGYLEFNLGAGSLKIKNIENFKADTIKMNIGAAKTVVDFKRRPYTKPTHLFISQAIASSTILIPDDMTCSVKSEGILNLKDIEACSDVENPDLIVHIEGALSSVNVIRK